MADDELKDENAASEENTPQSEPETESGDAAPDVAEENAGEKDSPPADENSVSGEGDPEGDNENIEQAEENQAEKSPEELAAEQAMLSELENSISDEDSEKSPDEFAAPDFPDRTVDGAGGSATENLDLLLNVSLTITVELGRREMTFGEVLELGKGSLVELSKVADEPVDIFVNHSKIAEGEVVIVEEHFGVRITKLLNTNRITRVG